MKAIKYIYALFLGLLMLGLGSCMEETEVNGGCLLYTSPSPRD